MNNIFTQNQSTASQHVEKLKRTSDLAILVPLTVKRVYDVILAFSMMLTIGLWLFPIIALFIRLGSKGPIFFKQLRHGKNDKPFYCYKFRTMVLNNEADTLQAHKGDKRITKFGKMLRKSSLDELPQLINVLKGDMALVGPRPHAMPMNDVFAKEIPGYMHRHVMKPGITGLAQSKGLRGEIRDYHDLSARYRMDIFYIKNWSLVLDVKILFWTFHTIFFNNGKAI